jgi:hypothetical protein
MLTVTGTQKNKVALSYFRIASSDVTFGPKLHGIVPTSKKLMIRRPCLCNVTLDEVSPRPPWSQNFCSSCYGR